MNDAQAGTIIELLNAVVKQNQQLLAQNDEWFKFVTARDEGTAELTKLRLEEARRTEEAYRIDEAAMAEMKYDHRAYAKQHFANRMLAVMKGEMATSNLEELLKALQDLLVRLKASNPE